MAKHYDFERVGRDDDFGIFEAGHRNSYIAVCRDCREAQRIVDALNTYQETITSWINHSSRRILGTVPNSAHLR